MGKSISGTIGPTLSSPNDYKNVKEIIGPDAPSDAPLPSSDESGYSK